MKKTTLAMLLATGGDPLAPGALPAAALENLLQKVKALDMDDVRRQIEAHEAEEGASE